MVVLWTCLGGCGSSGHGQGQNLPTKSAIAPAAAANSSIADPASPKPIPVEPTTPVVPDKFSYPIPKVSEISSAEARLVTQTTMLPHTDDTRYLEKVLIHWLSERPFERLCIAYTDGDSARESYTGEDIAFSGNRGGALPIEPFGNWVRMTPREADEVSKRQCNAMPFVTIIPNEIRYSQNGREFASVGCRNGISRRGLITHPYPEGARSFLAFREPDGSIHIRRGHRRFTDSSSIEYRIKDRIKRRHLFCDEEPPKP